VPFSALSVSLGVAIAASSAKACRKEAGRWCISSMRNGFGKIRDLIKIQISHRMKEHFKRKHCADEIYLFIRLESYDKNPFQGGIL
jgi:hypothetical protein